MRPDHPCGRFLLCSVVALAALVAFARGAEQQTGLAVHDVSLWIVDAGSPMANSRSAFPSALPVTVNSARAAPSTRASRRAAPIGLLTFHGPPKPGLDVDLRTSEGSFLAHWPPGESLPTRLRWAGTPPYNLVEAIDDETELMFVDDDDWIAQARRGDALYVRRGVRSERFLAYEAELKLDVPVRLEGGPDTFKVMNLTPAPLYDVLIARRTPEGIRVAWLDELPRGAAVAPREGAPKPRGARPAPNHLSVVGFPEADRRRAAHAKVLAEVAEAKARVAALKERRQAAQLAADANRRAAILQAAAAQANAQAETLAKVALAYSADVKNTRRAAQLPFGGLPAPGAQGVEVTLGKPLSADSPAAMAQATEALAERLAKAGLASHEVQLFVDHYGSLLFEDESLVVACRLAPATIEAKLPLSIFPAPAKTVRVGMVLVRNADPQLGEEIEKLIAQLGDPEFAVREAASARLIELGPLAVPACNQALNHADPEIVIRCERILLGQKQAPNPGAGAAGRAIPNGLINGGVIRAAPVIINR